MGSEDAPQSWEHNKGFRERPVSSLEPKRFVRSVEPSYFRRLEIATWRGATITIAAETCCDLAGKKLGTSRLAGASFHY